MTLRQPDWLKKAPTGLVVNVATLGPLGQKMLAPGTWGAFAGVLYSWLLFRSGNWVETVVWTLLLSYVAVGFTGEAARRLRCEDPEEVILDEFIVIPLVFLGWRAGDSSIWPEWIVAIVGFGLFRLFDIFKPFGIVKLQRWPGGWGIVVDDVVAALFSCASLHVLAWLWTLR